MINVFRIMMNHIIELCKKRGILLLIDSWESQEAIDLHHNSPMMKTILELREKYNLTMKVERYISDKDGIPESDKKYIKSE